MVVNATLTGQLISSTVLYLSFDLIHCKAHLLSTASHPTTMKFKTTSIPLTTLPHVSQISGVPNRLLGNYTKATT